MSDAIHTEIPPAEMSNEELHSALFAQLVMQQSHLAMMLLGKTPHPETGKTMKDLESARFFIDQLEMIEAKTRGNLSKEEAALLKQSLMSLRLAFVEAADSPKAPPQPASPSDQAAASPPTAAPTLAATATADEEHRTKFSKKY